eukprot:Tbor_TRINITY_DN7055_c0_g1::TRINITY_DN7055_c0_g1_i1::g.1671::m.1671/K17262/TBCB, CKAP1, ALF1; tubulin-folding cofactor B
MTSIAANTVVKVHLEHSINKGVVMEKRYVLNQTIASIKTNIATHYQTTTDGMRLDLKDITGAVIEYDLEDHRMLGYYQCMDDYTISVIHKDPTLYEDYDDLSKVEKYMMSDEDYDKRENTVRAFKAKQRAAKHAEMIANGIPIPEELHPDSYKEQAELIKVGDRCQCRPGDRLGTVRFVGRIAVMKPGYFIGVEFDEPVGKNDGTVKGHRLFECRPLYGGILRPDMLNVGDYPPEEF